MPTAIQGLSPKGVLPDTLVKGIAEVLCAETKEALSGLWEVLGTPPPPDLDDRLRKNGFSHAFTNKPLEGFSLHARPGLLSLHTASGLHVLNRRAFLRTSNRRPLERTWEGAKALRPLLTTTGLSDLEDAIEALLGLDEGEGRVEGRYVLARSGGFWTLWRGDFLGDPEFDIAALAGREVVLFPIEGVALSFRVGFLCSKAHLDRLDISWEGGNLCVQGDKMFSESLFAQRPIARLLQRGLSEALKRLRKPGRGLSLKGLSPKALTHLRLLSETGAF